VKGTGFSPYVNPTESTWALAPEGMLASVKGTGFSPYVNPTESTWALAPEGMLVLQEGPAQSFPGLHRHMAEAKARNRRGQRDSRIGRSIFRSAWLDAGIACVCGSSVRYVSLLDELLVMRGNESLIGDRRPADSQNPNRPDKMGRLHNLRA
jgi:hypothetical protein